MNTSITSSITDGQRKQYKRFVEDIADRALAEANLDKDGIQRLLENGDEFQTDILASIKRHSVSNQFADEEVASNYGYLSGYKPKGITEQTNVLRQLFPGIGYANEALAQQPLPEGAEGWFAIPRWQKVAKTYPEAVQIVLDLIKKTRNGRFCNYRKGQIESNSLRLRAKTQKALEAIGKQQEGYDILVIPCQFGPLHRGRSVRRALEVMPACEFGNDPFTVACMLLTHPERLQHHNDLWIDCAGAEYDCDGDGSFDGAPSFFFDVAGLGFDGYYAGITSDRFGSSSSFLSQ